MNTLESPFVWPAAPIAGRPYKCKFSFAAMRLVNEPRIPELQALPELSADADDAARAARNTDLFYQNIRLATFGLGVETSDQEWIPLFPYKPGETVEQRQVAVNRNFERLLDMIMPHEAAGLSRVAVEAMNLVTEAAKKATDLQSAPPSPETGSRVQ